MNDPKHRPDAVRCSRWQGLHRSFHDEIARFDWSRIKTYLGNAEVVPHALRGLIEAPDANEAGHFGRQMVASTMSNGVLTQVVTDAGRHDCVVVEHPDRHGDVLVGQH